MPIDRKHRP